MESDNSHEYRGNAVERKMPGREADGAPAAAPAGAPAKAEWREARPPAVDIVSSDGEVCLIMDLPGVREGGAEVSVEKNVLSVKATPAVRNYHGRRLIYAECGEGEYRRSFSLPEDVDRDNISATLKDGTMRIRLPKIHPCARKISVSVS